MYVCMLRSHKSARVHAHARAHAHTRTHALTQSKPAHGVGVSHSPCSPPRPPAAGAPVATPPQPPVPMFAQLLSGHATLAPAPPDDIPTPCAARPPPSPVCVLKFVSFCVFVCARDRATNTAASKDIEPADFQTMLPTPIHPRRHRRTRVPRWPRRRESAKSKCAPAAVTMLTVRSSPRTPRALCARAQERLSTHPVLSPPPPCRSPMLPPRWCMCVCVCPRPACMFTQTHAKRKEHQRLQSCISPHQRRHLLLHRLHVRLPLLLRRRRAKCAILRTLGRDEE